MRYRLLFIIGMLCSSVYANTVSWETMFAYNAVSQIAVSSDKVYALSDGALYAVNKQSEQIEIFNSGSGLHGKTIGSLYYDPATDMLIIGYTDGKIDLLHDGMIEYVSGLYTKDMTANKTINNITVHNNQAYLSMDFGIVTFNLKKHVIVDTYYIGAEASEVKVNDILISGDSIYAFGNTLLYKACLSDNIVDYRVWQTEALGRVQKDVNKGVLVTESDGEIWKAGKEEGVIRYTVTNDTLKYKPDGPLVNTPYSMTTANGKLYVVQGGRWGVQYNRPGHVMIYDGDRWHNISQQTIEAATNGNRAKDFMNVAVDPFDAEHFFVTAYGNGVYEFRNNQVVQQYLPDNSTLESAAPSNPKNYTRCTGGTFDDAGNYWVLTSGATKNIHRLSRDSNNWKAIDLKYGGNSLIIHTMNELIIDHRDERYKWIPSVRAQKGLVLLDDNGTIDDSDDRTILRDTWQNEKGEYVSAECVYTARQDAKGNIWVGIYPGIVIIPVEVDYFTSNRCKQIEIVEENGENPFKLLDIQAIEFDDKGQIWIGTSTVGVYVVSADWQTIVAHYTTENSLMPNNCVRSLAFETNTKKMFVGTDGGLVACTETSSSGGSGMDEYEETEDIEYGDMRQWKLHYSYANMKSVVQSPQKIYALAEGALFSVDKTDESIVEWNKSNGLSGSSIAHIAYDDKTNRLVICYSDGRIDLLDKDGNVTTMLDLYYKASTMSVTINSVYTNSGKAYLAMTFGVVVIDIAKAEVADTYYIGEDAANVNVQSITIIDDSLYVASESELYVAYIKDNMADYRYWQIQDLPDSKGYLRQMCNTYHRLYILQGETLYCRMQGHWATVQDSIEWISQDTQRLLGYKTNRIVVWINNTGEVTSVRKLNISDVLYDAKNNAYWMAVPYYGLCKWNSSQTQYYLPDGPISNNAYRLKYDNEQLFAVAGGRWGVQYSRVGDMSIYDGKEWRGISAGNTNIQCGTYPLDYVSCAAAKDLKGHFFVASYGRGVYEYQDYKAIKNYTPSNSTLKSAAPNNPNDYTRTEGAMVDPAGNLWVLNTSSYAFPINIMTPEKHWVGLELYNAANKQKISLSTPWEIVVDKRNSQYKWFVDQREDVMVYLLNDGGTPTNSSDDYCYGRREFYDQDGLQIAPTTIYCLAQDNNNDIWIGTPTGVFIIPASVDFFTSNECYRVKIPRNDGTNLADYLLGTEQVNCIAVDGANRKWIGTENSGLYLMSADGLTTEAHFTTDNSLLPSNTILSVAINPVSGEVFVGTSDGIASYRSDASEPQEDYNNAYAYPNPVRHNYAGVITITGLMENSVVNIVDEGGNLICKTRSNGGTAVWDGKNQQGQRASSGIYTALCNAPDGSHTAIKIMVMK
ncbi:MAG: two-component regulator propeller domain-containing protein [Paludibacteraceae bacterium]|nr:two-component regulator propeller domain-containing protein [Paludibacteraceae bacterium]